MALGVGITNGNILSFHGITEGSVEKKNWMIEYNNRKVYDCFNKPLPSDFGILALDITPITNYDIPCQDKRYQYTPDLIPASISVPPENIY